MHVPVECPECRRRFVVNGRGKCRCGASLIVHAYTPKYVSEPDRTYIHTPAGWQSVADRIRTQGLRENPTGGP